MAIKPLKITSYTTTNALGAGNAASLLALQQQQSGLSPNHFDGCDLKTFVGQVADLEKVSLPEHLSEFDCRNNRLTYLGLQQDNFSDVVLAARDKYGAGRVAVFLGTSTSGIQQTELAYAQLGSQLSSDSRLSADYYYTKTHNTFSLADFVQQYYGLNGVAHVVSTACSSSAKVFASAYRHMQAGFCDAAIVGGVDSLCLTTLYGFNSLQLVSEQKCTPWGKDRLGINIGEAAGFALLERSDDASGQLALLGYGESSDAYHMSTPHPQGRGAAKAMQAALDSAGLNSNDIDYINLHGTATQSNDSAEDNAVMTVFGDATAASSTKGWTGHTLGAAGITEVVFGCLSIENSFIPVNLNTQELDPTTSANIVMAKNNNTVNRFVSNSFGFGGSNCSLVIGRQG
ncbi:3-oxoacyl-[ACP] synthase FabV like [hydrothermal vent metagenome]|uniref:3-oxoacyl-[ACP] synthase FabV like n=1 Tax=hydrothermal vent metagenome TaxID=652676 RepID=A0A3B0ZYU4_9ZZZZ